MKKVLSIIMVLILILQVSCVKKPENKEDINEVRTSAYKAAEILETINKVNTYFQENLTANSNNWDDAVYHSGNIRAYMYSGNIEFYNYSLDYAKRHHYLVNKGQNTVNGDLYCISQTYIDLYKLKQENYILEDVIRNADYNAKGRTDFGWIDLVYMSLSVYAELSNITKDAKYIDDAYRAYLKARDIMWDEDASLFYRDARFVYDKNKHNTMTPSGKKILWSRGNGWAFAGLAKTLEVLDKNHESYEVYLKDFKAMAKSLKNRQREDGTWNANLDDPEHFGGIETSGTVMFMYGYAVGIKHGYLEYDEYFGTLQKAYDGVVKYAISEEGRLLYVQPVSDSPQNYQNYDNEEARRQSTKQYAVGIFVMAACELMSICEDYEQPELVIPEDDYEPIRQEDRAIDPNYYKGKIKVTATNQQEGNEAVKLVDGVTEDKEGHRWSCPGYGNSATLEFEEVLGIKKIVVVPYQNRAYRYVIEKSMDGKDFETVVDYRKNDKEWFFFSHDVDIEAKYIRIRVTGAHNYSGTWVSINEMLIYTKD